MALRDYRGSAQSTYTTVALSPTDMLIQTEGLTGWPDGDPGPFFVVINRQKSNEEKILCVSHNGTDLVVVPLEDGASGRGADETAPQNHAVGSVVEHIITATDAREANLHVNDHNAHVQSGNSIDRPDSDLFPGQMYYETDSKVLWIYGADGEWHASTAFPRLEESLDMQDKYRVVNLVDPVDAQDATTKSWVESQVPGLVQDDVQLAKDWAVKMDGLVNGEDYSSKYYANESATSAADAANSAIEAQASADAAANSATEAEGHKDETEDLWESFQNLYLGPRNYVPTNDTDGPLVIGMLYYNTVDGQMYVWDGGEWKQASSEAINTYDEYIFTATADQAVFVPTNPINPTFTQVFVNGILLPSTDYTATTSQVTLLDPANAGDLVVLLAFEEAAYSSGGGGGGTGPQGPPGDSAYEVWLKNGNAGTVDDYLASLQGEPGEPGEDGLSAYEIAVDEGFVGSEEAWLESLQGEPGIGIQVQGEVPTVADLDPLKPTASPGDAYIVEETGELWVFIDTGEFVNAGHIQGPPGPAGEDAYEVWRSKPENAGKTYDDWIEELTGPPGADGDDFTYDDFTPEQLAGLQGPQGEPGEDIVLPDPPEAGLVLTSTVDSYEWAESQGGSGIDVPATRENTVLQALPTSEVDDTLVWKQGMAFEVVQELPADDADGYEIGDVVFVLGDADPKGPSVGSWAEITDMTGDPKRYDYTADGVEWAAFEWTDDGSLTTQAGGLVDALVCGAGCASSSNPTNVKNGGKVVYGIHKVGQSSTITVGRAANETAATVKLSISSLGTISSPPTGVSYGLNSATGAGGNSGNLLAGVLLPYPTQTNNVYGSAEAADSGSPGAYDSDGAVIVRVPKDKVTATGGWV